MANLRELVLSANAGFRIKEIVIPEWNNAKVTIREPSAAAWLRWQEIIKPSGESEEVVLSISEQAHRNMRADVSLFIDIILDGDKPIFDVNDMDEVSAVYGPVHARIVKQALNLSITSEEAEKK
ncbi:phage tail assembly chaperone [Enterobacter huaxiensis]|uniref:phage tail assembly chaperone n=1 Tax=Enterobacter huaxiensis TaxID=2494702 RepID=UPI0021756FD0|nr:phage tail assembly chaperone [Enterobacter huaxiensis]MCS5452496.1 phage tail assembly chaperone [Enterobacter huaxiensis]